MMLRTDKIFRGIKQGKIEVEDRFCDDLPDWKFMEKYAYSTVARILWGFLYISIYYYFVPETALWLWIFLPFHFLMIPIQGVIINWFGHRIGYRNYEVSNTSTNLMPFDMITLGEGYHNNHHANAESANFSKKWYEFDFGYTMIVLFNRMGIIKQTNVDASKQQL